MMKISESFGINVKFLAGDWTEDTQAKLIDQTISEKPDLIIVTPINATTSTEWFKKLNRLGFPIVTCSSAPSDEAFKYILSHTGGDSWGQARLLAKKFAELMNFEGGYCIIQHSVGSSIYYARTYSFLIELKKIAPKMRCLDKQSTNLEYEKTKTTVTEWIQKYGKELKGLVIGDSGDILPGAMESVANANREDIIRVTVGNSKVSLDLMTQNKLHGVAWESPESDGALAIEIAIDFFNGLEILPVKYLPPFVITKENVEKYLPAQW
jgi:ribose transport system substrate-binding protein